MPALSDDEIRRRLEQLEGWERRGDAIVKEYKLADFKGSVQSWMRSPRRPRRRDPSLGGRLADRAGSSDVE